ncbi:DNA polymerase alpha, subunit B [Metschnikowia bicuspidata var. bicuspidata NRRL YB-4993]|uniref:DNA polymerase alpha subunit B n=1 Tax=Metschnikowia bicuspidata var. bicuspidata NRRL YB-4993 TaxID=869754 RepID=A0A1A0HB97_9ASCO|nr:DNA polymerase alpha, subunit B [Metschnikowia bicuspidata var. bicuspidata NRRL YB-4993]OBA21404.1 DNA polymerase alpha, subunit B [Metschnikowia bicuspidata var. bicuspidata NRRL YB-4993]
MADQPPLDTQTRDWFARKLGAVDDATVARLWAVKRLFNLSNDDVYINWESFVVTHEHGEMDPSPSSVDKFQHYLQQQISAAPHKKTPALKKVRDLAGAKRKPAMDFSSSPGVQLPSTPQFKKARPTSLASEPDSSPTRGNLPSSPLKSAAAPQENCVVETLNPHVQAAQGASHMQAELGADPGPGAVQVVRNYEPAKFRFRTMAMKLLESADVLDEQIDSVSLQMLDMYKGSDVLLGNPCMSSQFDIVCCGRIVPDLPLFDLLLGALNDKSLYLETSRLGGIGQRIPLDVSRLAAYSFFPGQVVGLKGRNPTGRTFVVHEEVPVPGLGVPVSSLDELQKHRASCGPKVFVAAGPFCNQHSLDYAKLAALVALLNAEIRPHVAILFGPFLDVANTAVQAGDVHLEGVPPSQQPRTLDELFRLQVTPLLKQIDRNIHVILVPSLRDAASKHASYPQAALDRKRLGLPKNFHCYANPSSFSVNEALFATSNMDVFKDLKDVYKASPDGAGNVPANRFDRIANHVFQQKRYYPVFPGAVRKAPLSALECDRVAALNEGVAGEDLADIAVGGSCLEVPYLGLTELVDSLPDVMLIPSEMNAFAKVVRGVVVVNPGQFVRPSKDASRLEGNYAVLSIKPPDDAEPDNIEPVENSDLYYHNIYKRCRVDIYRS